MFKKGQEPSQSEKEEKEAEAEAEAETEAKTKTKPDQVSKSERPPDSELIKLAKEIEEKLSISAYKTIYSLSDDFKIVNLISYAL